MAESCEGGNHRIFGGGLGVLVGQTWEEGKVNDIVGKSLEEQDEALLY